MNNKLIYAVMIIFCSFILFGCKEDNNVKINLVKDKEIISHFEDNETFLMVIGSSICFGCKEYKETTLTEYLKTKDHMTLYYVDDMESFDDDLEFEMFKQDNKINYKHSPTTYFVKNGKVVDSIEITDENKSLQELKDFISNNA